MELPRIARILYNMSLDMDYKDYIDQAEPEIEAITEELQELKNKDMSCLLYILDDIALQNESMESWKENIRKQ